MSLKKDFGFLICMFNINNTYDFYYSHKKEINDDPRKKFCDLLLKWCQNDILWQTLRLYLSSQYILRVVVLLQVVYICISARDFTSKNYHRPVKMTLKAFEWVKTIKFKPNICIAEVLQHPKHFFGHLVYCCKRVQVWYFSTVQSIVV